MRTGGDGSFCFRVAKIVVLRLMSNLSLMQSFSRDFSVVAIVEKHLTNLR